MVDNSEPVTVDAALDFYTDIHDERSLSFPGAKDRLGSTSNFIMMRPMLR